MSGSVSRAIFIPNEKPVLPAQLPTNITYALFLFGLPFYSTFIGNVRFFRIQPQLHLDKWHTLYESVSGFFIS